TETYSIIHNLISGKTQKSKPLEGQTIKPLYLFTNKQVELYAKLKGLKYTKPKESKDKISKFIDELEIKHPEVKRAVVGGYLGLS
ncbi:MAG: hypothetical protein ABIB79_02280, partial [archaeon]